VAKQAAPGNQAMIDASPALLANSRCQPICSINVNAMSPSGNDLTAEVGFLCRQ
jgi:hypothetical protein